MWTAYHQDRRERGRTAASLLGCCSFPRSPFSLGCFLAASLAASGRVLRQHPETGGLFCQVACFSLVAPVWFWGVLVAAVSFSQHGGGHRAARSSSVGGLCQRVSEASDPDTTPGQTVPHGRYSSEVWHWPPRGGPAPLGARWSHHPAQSGGFAGALASCSPHG